MVKAVGLEKTFRTGGMFGYRQGGLHILKNIDFEIVPGETVGLVGESGSGKTTLGRALVRLLKLDDGKVYFQGEDLYAIPLMHLRRRRREFQMLFQNPSSTLHPRMNVRQVLEESLAIHQDIPKSDNAAAVADLLERVHLPGREDSYPSELSGGEKRRVGIARLLVASPKFVVADEPTAGLDAVLKQEILELLLEVKGESTSYLIISHDLNVIRMSCRRIVVMFHGAILEHFMRGTPDELHHPYTRELFHAAHVMKGEERRGGDSGMFVVALEKGLQGCVYYDQCPWAIRDVNLARVCRNEEPKLKQIHPEVQVACHKLHWDGDSR